MGARLGLRAGVIGGVLALALAPAALADTCCANVVVQLSPVTASPGERVTASGIRCLRYDNSGPIEFAPSKFYLSAGHQSADANPGDTPGNGQGLPADLPAVEHWPALRDHTAAAGGIGSAVLVVPDLPGGSYQLWWWCDNGGGPGSGIHYSDGPRLTVTGSPETDASASEHVAQTGEQALLPVVVGFWAGLGMLLVLRLRHRERGDR